MFPSPSLPVLPVNSSSISSHAPKKQPSNNVKKQLTLNYSIKKQLILLKLDTLVEINSLPTIFYPSFHKHSQLMPTL